MKSFLWISRHQMTDSQREDLERILGEPVTVVQEEDTVQDVQKLQPLVQQADAIGAVLPPDLLEKLFDLCSDKPLLRAVSARVPTGRTVVLQDGRKEQEFAFVHRGWEQILEITVKTRMLSGK